MTLICLKAIVTRSFIARVCLVAGEVEVGWQGPAECAQCRQRLVAARVAGHTEMVAIGDFDGDLVALLEAECLDHGGGQADGKAIAPAADLHVGFPF